MERFTNIFEYFRIIYDFFLSLQGLTKGEHLIASCHPADKLSLAAFTVSIF